jgi:hypothetical protein
MKNTSFFYLLKHVILKCVKTDPSVAESPDWGRLLRIYLTYSKHGCEQRF